MKAIVTENEPTFAIGGTTWRARGKLTAVGFVIFAGSTVNRVTESFRRDPVYYPIRERLHSEGVISGDVITKDYVFKSAAQAGSVVACRYIATNSEWKTDDEFENTWGSVHGTKNSASDFVRPKKRAKKSTSAFRPKEGSQLDGFGVYVFFRTNPDGSTVERRGRCW